MNRPEPELPEVPERQNHHFVQLSKAYLRDYRHLIRKSPIAAEILMFLVERMGKTTNAVVCSTHVLIEVTGVSRQSVSKAVNILQKDNWIDIVKIGGVRTFAVNERVVWASQANHRHYAIFSATVIATESEQGKGFKPKAVKDKPKLKNIPIVGEIENDRLIVNTDEKLPPPDQHELDV